MTAPRLLDRVKETVTTEGTGSYTVGATPATGYRAITAAFANGETGIFAVEDGIGGYEVFVGTYTSPTTLTRTTILRSSNSNLAVNWGAGNKTLACVMTAEYADLVRMKHNLVAVGAPTANDDAGDGYHVGSIWIYGTTAYICTTETTAAAVWTAFALDIAPGATSLSIGTTITSTGVYSLALGYIADTGANDTSTALGANAVVGATSEGSVVVGASSSTQPGAAYSVAVGALSSASGAKSTAVGYQAGSSFAGSVALGWQGHAWYPNAIMHAHDNGTSYGAGAGHVLLYKITTDDTPAFLEFYNDAATHGELGILAGDSIVFRGVVVARSNTEAKGWAVEGMARRNTAGNITLVGTPTVTEIGEDAGTTAWALAVSVDTTEQSVRFDVTGAAATTIRWTGHFQVLNPYFY